MRRFTGKPSAASSMVRGSPGFMESMSMPKIIWVRTEFSIWRRGSAAGSVERMSRRRPSSGVALCAAGKVTSNL